MRWCRTGRSPTRRWTFQEFVNADHDPDGIGGFGVIDNNWAIRITQIIITEPGALTALVLGGLLMIRLR